MPVSNNQERPSVEYNNILSARDALYAKATAAGGQSYEWVGLLNALDRALFEADMLGLTTDR